MAQNGANGCWPDSTDPFNVVNRCWVNIAPGDDISGLTTAPNPFYYYASFVAVLDNAIDDSLTLSNPGNSYNHDKDRYEYIEGLGASLDRFLQLNLI